MTQTNLVRVGDIGASYEIQFTHGYECPCDACSNCEPVRPTRRPFYLAADMVPEPPQPTAAEFPQTMRYDATRRPHVLVDCGCRDCEVCHSGGVPVAAWAWLAAASIAGWAGFVAFVGWLLSFVVGN